MTHKEVPARKGTGSDATPHGKLGPYPAFTVTALAGLGLNDQEIARYLGIGRDEVRTLRLDRTPELTLVGTTLVPHGGRAPTLRSVSCAKSTPR